MTHPIATYELDEEKLLDATITEVAEARAHLNDAESAVAALREKPGAAVSAEEPIERAKSCLQVAAARLQHDEIGLTEVFSVVAEAMLACDAALAHVRIFETRDSLAPLLPEREFDVKQAGSHAAKAVDAARRVTHMALAHLLAGRAA